MRPEWLIEAGVFGEEATPLVSEIRRQGMSAEVVPYRVLARRSTAATKLPPPDACVLGYGTYPFAQQILLHEQWRPGAWCNADNLHCACYYPRFSPWLLNHVHAMLPGVEAIAKREELFEEFSRGGRVFLRPASSDKLFVGRCVDREAFADALGPWRYDPAAQVVVAPPRTIDREGRMVVVGDRVVAGSQYAVRGAKSVEPGFPLTAGHFARSVLREAGWRPDPVFMMDVCESEGRLCIVELNSFSGSWLYRCDLAEVVAAASEAAETEPTESA